MLFLRTEQYAQALCETTINLWIKEKLKGAGVYSSISGNLIKKY